MQSLYLNKFIIYVIKYSYYTYNICKENGGGKWEKHF